MDIIPQTMQNAKHPKWQQSQLILLNIQQLDFQEDMVKVTKDFQETVSTYPETIECKSQNIPMSEVFSTNLGSAGLFTKEVQPDGLYTSLVSGHKSKLDLGYRISLFSEIYTQTQGSIKNVSDSLGLVHIPV